MLNDEKGCKTHKILMGIGMVIFSLVLYFSSSIASLTTNLNWPAAFFVLGILCIIKAFFFTNHKK